VSNTSVLLAARLYGALAAAALAVVTVRLLSVEEYGRLATAMAIVAVVAMVTESGIAALATRQITLDEQRTDRILGLALSAEVATATVGGILLVPLGLLLGYPDSVVVLLALGSVLILAQGALAALGGVFQARRVFELFALCVALQATVQVVGGVGALVAGLGAAGLVASAGLAYAAAACLAYVLVGRRIGAHPVFDGTRRKILAFLREAAPMAIVASIGIIYARLGLVLLSKLDDERAVAVYNLPLTIVELTILVPAAIATSFYPLLTRQLAVDRPDAERSVDLLLRLFVLASVPIALVLGLGGTDIITFAFGDAYAEAGDVMAVLAVTVVTNFFSYLAWYALLAARREGRRIPAVITGLVLNVVLCVVLIPRHGAVGAATALVVSDVFMVAWVLVVVHTRVVALHADRVVLRALPAVAAAGAAAVLLPGGGLVAGVVASVVWIAVLLATGYIGRGEWEPLLAPLRGLRKATRGT
jgi:O-antigen/teichoic acid export membrane protein